MFCIVLCLQEVYDKDTFSTDDRMGEVEIDIQPLVVAAKAYENSTMTESVQLGKWLASEDNTLVKDSVINLAEGKVKQEIALRLQNVERGELEIELECVPLSQWWTKTLEKELPTYPRFWVSLIMFNCCVDITVEWNIQNKLTRKRQWWSFFLTKLTPPCSFVSQNSKGEDRLCYLLSRQLITVLKYFIFLLI